MRAKTREFYLKIYPNVSELDYDQNEGAFLLMVHNTRVDLAPKEVVKLFTDTFGQKPNMKNARQLFENKVIQKLWFNADGFGHSMQYKAILNELTVF